MSYVNVGSIDQEKDALPRHHANVLFRPPPPSPFNDDDDDVATISHDLEPTEDTGHNTVVWLRAAFSTYKLSSSSSTDGISLSLYNILDCINQPS